MAKVFLRGTKEAKDLPTRRKKNLRLTNLNLQRRRLSLPQVPDWPQS